MSQVHFRRLTLAGFGLYGRPVTAVFPPGLGVFVGPNETGKSTLAAGLAATLFGLPRDSNPRAFGSQRFRHWPGAPEFRGELELTVDGQTWLIRRDFESQLTEVREERDGEWRTVVSAPQTPGGRSDAVRQYQELLRQLVGIADRELYEAVFFLGQDQARQERDKISLAVQQLISGSGAAGFHQVLGRLFQEFTALSKLSGDFEISKPGVRPRNQRKDGRLDRLEQELAEKERELEAGREGLAALAATDRELEELAQEIAAGEAERQQLEDSLALWERWEGLNGQRRRLEESQLALERAGREHEEAWARERELERELQGELKLFAAGPPELESRLGELQELAVRQADRRRRLDEARQRRERLREEEQAVEDILEGHCAPVRNKPQLQLDLERLATVRREQRQLDEALARLEAESHRLAGEQGGMKDWSVLGERPDQAVARARTAAAAVARELSLLAGRRERRGAIRRELEEKYAVFEQAGEEDQRQATGFARRLSELAAARREATEELGRRQTALETIASLAGTLERDFADLAGAPADLVERVRAKLELERALAATGAELKEARAGLGWFGQEQRFQWGLGAGLLAGVAAGALVANLTSDLGKIVGTAVVIGLAMGATAYTASGWTAQRREWGERRRRLEERERQQTEQLARLQADLGDFANVGAEDFGRLQERRQRRAELEAELGRLKAGDPAAGLARAEARLKELAAEQEGLAGRLGRFQQAFGDRVEEAYAAWRVLRAEEAALAASLEEGAAACFGGGGEGGGEWSERPAAELGGSWEPVVLAARAAGWSGQTAGELAGWLAEEEDRFAALEAEAARWVEIAARRRQLAAERRQLLGEGRGEDRRAAQAARAAELREAVAPFTADTPREEVARLAAELAEAERRQRAVEARLEELPDLGRLEREATAAAEALAERRRPLEPYLEAAGGDARLAAERARRARELAAERQALAERRQSVLNAQNAPSPEALAERRQHLLNDVLGLGREAEELERGSPLLASLKALDDPLARQQRLESARAAWQELKRLVREKQRAHNERTTRRADLRGRRFVNLAAAEGELAAGRAERERLERERAAIKRAWDLISESIAAYQDSHRERLQKRITERFRFLTLNPGRRVELDDQFFLRLFNADGTEAAVEQLSQGTQDQLYLAVRLAVADVVAGAADVPFLFDDPFLTSDAGRLQAIRQALNRLAAEKQVLVLSHQGELAGWGAAVALDERGEAGAG